jgi:hypothetical protein
MLAFASRVSLLFMSLRDPLPYFCSFRELRFFKWDLLYDEGRSLTTTGALSNLSPSSQTYIHTHYTPQPHNHFLLWDRKRSERKFVTLHLKGEARHCFSGFEGSQAVPAGPSGSGNMTWINIYIMLEGLHYGEMLTLPMGGLHVKHAVQRGIWVPTRHLL